MKIAIIGAGELGKSLCYYAVSDQKYEIVGYYDDFKLDKEFNGYPILGNSDSILKDYKKNLFDRIIIALGYNQMPGRSGLFQKFKNIIPFANIIHSSSYVDKSCKLGEGIAIFPGAVIDYGVVIEDNVIINTGGIIAHHTKIGSNTFVAPGVQIAGYVNIGSSCFIGVGSTIIDCLNISEYSVVGGGSVVIKNTEPHSVSVGVPAKLIKIVKYE